MIQEGVAYKRCDYNLFNFTYHKNIINDNGCKKIIQNTFDHVNM